MKEAQYAPLDREGSGVGEKHGAGLAIYDSIYDYGEEQAIQNSEYNRGRKVARERYTADGGRKRHKNRALGLFWCSRSSSNDGDNSVDERKSKHQEVGVIYRCAVRHRDMRRLDGWLERADGRL